MSEPGAEWPGDAVLYCGDCGRSADVQSEVETAHLAREHMVLRHRGYTFLGFAIASVEQQFERSYFVVSDPMTERQRAAVAEWDARLEALGVPPALPSPPIPLPARPGEGGMKAA